MFAQEMEKDVNSQRISRLDKAVKWLIFEDLAASENDLLNKINRNPSSLSQARNSGKVSDSFFALLCTLDSRLNLKWLTDGDGEMLLSGPTTRSDNDFASQTQVNDYMELIKKLSSKISILDKKIDMIIKKIGADEENANN